MNQLGLSDNNKSLPLKNPLILALDTNKTTEIKSILKETGDLVGGYKIGPRLIVQSGKKIIHDLSHYAPVFVDMKYHDIPSTMLESVRVTFESGASLITVHGSAGEQALRLLSDLEKELNQQRPFRILVVTVLTSFSEEGLPPHQRSFTIDKQVEMLVQMTYEAGLRGIVCSPHELSNLIKKYDDLFIVTPGIRRKNDEISDQKRIMEPQDAIKMGASAIVVGRPILTAASLRDETKAYLNAIYG